MSVSVRPEYAIIFFQLSKQTEKITRKYQSYLNVVQEIGGVCEIIIFVFVFLVLYHHELILELYLLNNAVLLSHLNTEKETKAKPNQVADSKMTTEKSLFEHQEYSYWELAGLKHFSCCRKKSPRNLEYR